MPNIRWAILMRHHVSEERPDVLAEAGVQISNSRKENIAHAIRFFRFDAVTGQERELREFTRSSELKFNWTLSGDGSMLAIAAWR